VNSIKIRKKKLGLDGVAGVEILENCQKYKHRLAARGLPPGASVVAVLLRGCDVMRRGWVLFQLSWDQ